MLKGSVGFLDRTVPPSLSPVDKFCQPLLGLPLSDLALHVPEGGGGPTDLGELSQGHLLGEEMPFGSEMLSLLFDHLFHEIV